MAKKFKYVLELPPKWQRVSFQPGVPRRFHVGNGKFLVSALIRPACKRPIFPAIILLDSRQDNKHLDVFFMHNRELVKLREKNAIFKLGLKTPGDLFPYEFTILNKEVK